MAGNTTPSTPKADTHSELRKLWSSEEPKRANGGWWSLSGFSIQAMIAFDRFVRRSLIEGRGDAFSFEAISDLSEVGEKVRLIQVKRTLTRTSLASAVAEACKVVALCSPALLKTVEFQVICERDEAGLKPADLTAQNVFGSDRHALNHLTTVLARFDKFEPVKVVGNPALSLRRTLLEAGVRDPDKVARDVLGRMFDAFDGRDRDGVEEALHAAMSDIHASIRPEDAVPGRLITADHFVLRSLTNSALFTGARPRLDELVSGRFLARPRTLEPLTNSAVAWLSGLPASYEENDRKLPVLWLEGRMGDGKSILTLQLVEALIKVRGRLASVVELKSAHELSAWLETASLWDTASPNHAEIGFIDDLASRTQPGDLDAIVDDAFYRGSSYVGLITSGTAENGQAFATGRHVAVTKVGIGVPDDEAFEALRRWAELRRGRPIAVAPKPGATLSEYVVDLSLEGRDPARPSAGVSAQLRAALAVNALGLPAPRSMVTDADILAFSQVRPHFELSPVDEADGIRLAHAEAAWSLYASVEHGIDLADRWGTDLAAVIARRLSENEESSARTVLGVLLNTRYTQIRLRRQGSLSAETALLDAAYRALMGACPAEARAPLFRLWLVAARNGRLTATDLMAVRNEGNDHLSSKGVSDEVKAEVAAALLTIGGQRDDEPWLKAAEFLKAAGPYAPAAKFAISTLLRGFAGVNADISVAWIQHNRRSEEVGEVLGRVLDPSAPTVLQVIGTEFVTRFLDHPVSGAVLAKLATFHRTAAFYRLQDQWLSRCPDPARAVAIYRDQLHGAQWRNYAGRALDFVQIHPHIRGCQDLLTVLIRRRGDGEVVEAARAWLDQHVGEGAATPVLMELVEAQPLEAADLQRALVHIDRGGAGASPLFATVAVVLRTKDAPGRAKLRSQLARGVVYVFDQAVGWKFKLEGRLKLLHDRLTLISSL